MEELQLIRIVRGISIVSPWPALLLEKEDTLVIADLHLGLEDERESRGIHIPVTTIPKIIDSIVRPVKTLGCSKAILLGDVKHEFGRPSEAEWFSVKKLVKSLRDEGCEPEVVRGNHDNYIIVLLKDLDVKFYDPHLQLGNLLLIHGHQPLNLDEFRADHIILGHEHPVISVKDDVGIKHRFKAFLTGRLGSRRYTILPSASPLSYGSDINEVSDQGLFSPILKGRPIEDLTPYMIEIGVTVKKFPKIRYL